jgi:hypothetical protein
LASFTRPTPRRLRPSLWRGSGALQANRCVASILSHLWLWHLGMGTRTFMALPPLHDAPYVAFYEEGETLAALQTWQKTLGEDVPDGVSLLVAEYQKHLLSRARFPLGAAIRSAGRKAKGKPDPPAPRHAPRRCWTGERQGGHGRAGGLCGGCRFRVGYTLLASSERRALCRLLQLSGRPDRICRQQPERIDGAAALPAVPCSGA